MSTLNFNLFKLTMGCLILTQILLVIWGGFTLINLQISNKKYLETLHHELNSQLEQTKTRLEMAEEELSEMKDFLNQQKDEK